MHQRLADLVGHLEHLVDYAISWFETLQENYGKGRKRRTSFDEIEQIAAAKVIAANQRLYVDREGGFVGLNWRQHEFITECRPIDQVLCVDCGICSSVCPSGALQFPPATQRLHFEASRCLVCEQCIPSCPLEAITLVLEP